MSDRRRTLKTAHTSTALAAAAMAAAALAPGGHTHAQVRLASERIGDPAEFPLPTFLTQPPGESRRLYVTLKGGTIRIIRDGQALAAPLLTGLPGLISGVESGLLGLAFHPQFQANGFMYILYQTAAAPAGTRIERYTLDPANPETADPAMAHAVMTIDRHPGAIHQGGWIGFGPDGYLYISSGEGGQMASAQLPGTHLGKVLRIDVDADGFPLDPGKNYAIPPGNPLAGSPGALPEIWALGLRNPWRCSFDRETGELFIADVGSGVEEIDLLPAAPPPPGEAPNLGWPCMEGSRCSTPACCRNADMTWPIFEYSYSAGGPRAVIGGYLYRGSSTPALRGAYVFGDLSGAMWSFRPGPPSGMWFTVRSAEMEGDSVYAFGEDRAGELYYCTPSQGVFRIVPHCRANCDGSTEAPLLDVRDFACFIGSFAAGDPYANCDGSSAAPALNVADFTCFLRGFARGCP